MIVFVPTYLYDSLLIRSPVLASILLQENFRYEVNLFSLVHCCVDQLVLPTNPGWWLMFEASKRDVEIISLEILQLYTYPNVSHAVLKV